MIVRPDIGSPFSFWDMYKMTRFDRLEDSMLAALETDARQSLDAARIALPLVPDRAREKVDITIISAERRLYLATSARHMLKALALEKSGDAAGARAEMNACLEEAGKMVDAAHGLGIEFPMAVHDAQVVARYRQILAGL